MKLEDQPLREAVHGYKKYNRSYSDDCNVHRMLVTVPPGQSVVPSATITMDRNVVSFQQQPIIQEFYRRGESGEQIDPYSSITNMGVVRFGSNAISVGAQYTRESFPSEHYLDGFRVSILLSSSDGYLPQHHALDMNSEIVVGADLKILTTTYGD
jgi:hypothetical protein